MVSRCVGQLAITIEFKKKISKPTTLSVQNKKNTLYFHNRHKKKLSQSIKDVTTSAFVAIINPNPHDYQKIKKKISILVL